MQEMWHFTRVVNHLVDRSVRCQWLYRNFVEEMDEQEFVDLQEIAKQQDEALVGEGWRINKALKPVQRLDGPLVPLAELNGINHKYLLKGRPPEWT